MKWGGFQKSKRWVLFKNFCTEYKLEKMQFGVLSQTT